MKSTQTILRADRNANEAGACNECLGKEMFACIEEGGVVECYFPTKSAFERKANLFVVAPDLLEALNAMLQTALNVDDKVWADAIRRSGATRPCDMAAEAIAKAKGDK